jgi:hypothetical protein
MSVVILEFVLFLEFAGVPLAVPTVLIFGIKSLFQPAKGYLSQMPCLSLTV